MPGPNFRTTHPYCIFQPGPTWWTIRPTWPAVPWAICSLKATLGCNYSATTKDKHRQSEPQKNIATMAQNHSFSVTSLQGLLGTLYSEVRLYSADHTSTLEYSTRVLLTPWEFKGALCRTSVDEDFRNSYSDEHSRADVLRQISPS